MAVIIGSARSDENGKLVGGKPGDQKNGQEVSTQEWYLHDKGWVVIRAKDAAIREKLAHCMERACDNNMIGYAQDTSYQLFDALKNLCFDPDRLTKNVNTDCSSLVRVCCYYAGIVVPYFSTKNEVQMLNATGKFDILTSTNYTNYPNLLKRGDILCTKTQGHTVIVLNDGDTKALYPVKISATVKDAKYQLGQKLSAADFTVRVTMNDGSVLVNPEHWNASTLTLTEETTKIYVTYYSVSTFVLVTVDGAITKITATVGGTHYVGDKLSAKDFTVKVYYRSGKVVTNPECWWASTLLLDKEVTPITVEYQGSSTVVNVKAINKITKIVPTNTTKYYVGDKMKAADFTIKIYYADGTVVTNPEHWYADPLVLKSTSNRIKIWYQTATTYMTIKAEPKK